MAQYSLPLAYDMTVYTGTSYRREFRWLPDGVNPIDFTGWTARMLIGAQGGTADLELTSTTGITLGTDGKLTITLTPAQTANLAGGITYYQLDLTEPDGFVRRFLRGKVSVVVDVKAPV